MTLKTLEAYGFLFSPIGFFHVNMSQNTSSDDGVPGPSFWGSDGPSSGSLSHLSGGVSTHLGTTLSLQALIGNWDKAPNERLTKAVAPDPGLTPKGGQGKGLSRS